MVAAIRTETYIRELDLFRAKLGIDRGPSAFEVASENELRWNLNKFLVDKNDHTLESTDGQ